VRAARAVVALVVPFLLGACSADLDAAGARSFTRAALEDAGLGGVAVGPSATPCEVDGARGWRTSASTDAGEVSLCVSRDQGRALSVRDPGLTDAQFARLESFRSGTPQDRARPLAAGSAALLLVGVLIRLVPEVADRRAAG
jgi:hypothetical protein